MVQLSEQGTCLTEGCPNDLNLLEARISAAYTNVTKDIRVLLRNSGGNGEISPPIQRRLLIGATWIYFIRMTRHIWGPSTAVTTILEDIFDDKETGIDSLNACNLPFAVLVLGSEAASETRRRSVLDLIDRAVDTGLDVSLSPSATYNPLGQVTNMLKTTWTFNDLHVGNEVERHLDYRQKMDLVFTRLEVLPALA